MKNIAVFSDLVGKHIEPRRRRVAPLEATRRSSMSDDADGHLRLSLEQVFEVRWIGRQQNRRRSVADGGRCHQSVDPVIRPREKAQSACSTGGRLVGRQKHARGPFEDAEDSIHCGVSPTISRRALNEHGGRHADRAVVIEDPSQPPTGALRPADQRG
jgi:hypothetical protein